MCRAMITQDERLSLFLKDIPICRTHFGVRSLLRKHFLSYILVDKEEYLLVEVKENVRLEMSRRKARTSQTFFQECKLICDGNTKVIWKQEKLYRKKYYSNPVLMLPE